MPGKFKLLHGWPIPDVKDGRPISYQIRNGLFIPIVGAISKFWLNWVTNAEVHNADTLRWWVNERPPDQPLITFCNHHSCLDDPLMFGVLPMKSFLITSRMRWSLAAHDVLFTRKFLSWFFASGKCVPCIRGIGVNQRGMDFCSDRLQEGSWVHIFPEGKVNAQHEHLRLKWGIGRLVYDCWRGEYEPSVDHLYDDSIAKSCITTNTLGYKAAAEAYNKYGTSLTFAAATHEQKPNLKPQEDYSNDSSVFTKKISQAHDSESNFHINVRTDSTFNENGSTVLDTLNKTKAGADKKYQGREAIPFHNCSAVTNRPHSVPTRIPVVLPIYHCGMDSVLPNKKPYIPRVGQKVTIVIGEPIYLEQIMEKIDHQKMDRVQSRQLITDYIQEHFNKLREKAEDLHSRR